MVTTWECGIGCNKMLCSLATVTHTWLHNKLFPTPDEVRAVSAATQVTCQKLTKHTMKPFTSCRKVDLALHRFSYLP